MTECPDCGGGIAFRYTAFESDGIAAADCRACGARWEAPLSVLPLGANGISVYLRMDEMKKVYTVSKPWFVPTTIFVFWIWLVAGLKGERVLSIKEQENGGGEDADVFAKDWRSR